MARDCTIIVDYKRTTGDVHLSLSHHALINAIPEKACLRFLSVVETSRIPLHLILGSPFSIHTSNSETENWFHDILLQHVPSENNTTGLPWWTTAKPDSSLGILVSVPVNDDSSSVSRPRVTELLFYASRSSDVGSHIPVSASWPFAADELSQRPPLSVHAVAVSSDLIHQAQSEPTPPPSPTATDVEISAVFLPQPFPLDAQIIHAPPVRKRKSAADVFDEASERRQKARRRGGEGVSAAAATKVDPQSGPLQHRRGHSFSQPAPLQTTTLSRSPSVSSSRPPTALLSGSRVSTLSRVQSASAITDTVDLETKNKNIISRIVMAGMRLYGLSQSKSRRSRADSSAPSPTVDATFEDQDAERKKDEEFKLIYHQAFKGTCCAFRAVIAKQSLQASSDAIRDVADKLLAIFCNDPLDGPKSDIAEMAPVRKDAFG